MTDYSAADDGFTKSIIEALDREDERERVRHMRKLLVDAMRREHNANEYKGGWTGRGNRRHKRDLDYHVAKLFVAMETHDANRAVEYAADICNHALFALDDMLGEFLEAAIIDRNHEGAYVFPGRRFYLRLMFISPYHVLKYGRKCLAAIFRGHTDYEGVKT